VTGVQTCALPILTTFNEQLQRDIAGISVWRSDCRGYYRAPSGRIVTQCPYTMTTFREILAAPDMQNYETAAVGSAVKG